MGKFAQSARIITEQNIAQVIDPGTISESDLRRVHTADYIRAIDTGNYDDLTARKLGLPWHPTIPRRSRAATAGTLQAARAAFEDGLAANLAGGTHHAFADHGEGYCVFNDVAVCVRALQQEEPLLQVFVADCDAHQGNGTNHIFQNDPNVLTYSIHVGRNYPSTKEPGSIDVELPRYVAGDEYLSRLHETLPPAIERFEPDLLFFNAGVDVHEDDRFGQMKLSTQQMRERDKLVISTGKRWGIPTVLVYGGGYNKTPGMTAELHVQSIQILADHVI
jgi:acetoin utilization deacetylase AcuC-like enzyme